MVGPTASVRPRCKKEPIVDLPNASGAPREGGLGAAASLYQ